jgi:hypothetical protein
MRVCVTCNYEKEETEFYLKDKKTGRLGTSCKQCHSIKVAKWQNENRDKVRSYIRKSCKKAYDADPEKYKKKSREKRRKNPELARLIVSKSYKKIYQLRPWQERARNNANVSYRRAATPKWLTPIQKAQIREFYELAKAKEMQTGIKYHVDHIMPINGLKSSGLHVPWNLQILSASENCAKKNAVIGD